MPSELTVTEKTWVKLSAERFGGLIVAIAMVVISVYGFHAKAMSDIGLEMKAQATVLRQERREILERYVTREELYRELGNRFEKLENRIVLQLRGR